jgi:ornithine cyclodeaminase/alanine dehydrogenase-like protein (mu-crystallin family)
MIPADLLRKLTPWPDLIEAIAAAFLDRYEIPKRLHYDISPSGAATGTLLLMPAWIPGGMLGVKILQVFPGNSSRGKPAIHGIYMLASAIDGDVRGIIDAQELTARRTAAVSALASRYLSRPESRQLLVMGTGRLALNMVAAHAAVRPIRNVAIWGRSTNRAQSVAAEVRQELRIDATWVDNLPAAIRSADIISTVTTANDPILAGKHLRPGTHVDLVGGFTPLMREADDDVVRSASIFVDSLSATLEEAGDLSNPLARGVIHRADIRGDLFGLCNGMSPKRGSADEITVFKSVGIALEDLAAATFAWNAFQSTQP